MLLVVLALVMMEIPNILTQRDELSKWTRLPTFLKSRTRMMTPKMPTMIYRLMMTSPLKVMVKLNSNQMMPLQMTMEMKVTTEKTVITRHL